MKAQIQTQRQRCEEKREYLSEQFKNYVCYRHLIERNKHQSHFDSDQSISLPFILVSTKDSPDNEVEISFGDCNRSLNIAMKKPMKCIGDADTLMKLRLYKVDREWLRESVPEAEKYMGMLNETQVKDIIE